MRTRVAPPQVLGHDPHSLHVVHCTFSEAGVNVLMKGGASDRAPRDWMASSSGTSLLSERFIEAGSEKHVANQAKHSRPRHHSYSGSVHPQLTMSACHSRPETSALFILTVRRLTHP